jgi:hypothetical protein
MMVEVSVAVPVRSDLAGAVRRLQDAGIADRQIRVLTREPLAVELPSSGHSRMSKLGVIGAVFGFSFAIALVAGTLLNYPLYTGGMPIVPAMTTGVVTYELTLLCSAITMVFVLFYEGGFGPGSRPRGARPHPELQADQAIISVICATAEQVEHSRLILAHVRRFAGPERGNR